MRLPAKDLLLLIRRALSRGDSTRPPLELAGALIQDPSGRFLLLHRNTEEMRWWEVPGGKVEQGEGLWQAAQRELAEELNAFVEPVEELGTGEFDHDGRTLRYTWYVARVVGGEPRVMEADRFDEVRYFTPSELDLLDDPSPSLKRLFELHRDRLHSISSGQRSGLAPNPVQI